MADLFLLNTARMEWFQVVGFNNVDFTLVPASPRKFRRDSLSVLNLGERGLLIGDKECIHRVSSCDDIVSLRIELLDNSSLKFSFEQRNILKILDNTYFGFCDRFLVHLLEGLLHKSHRKFYIVGSVSENSSILVNEIVGKITRRYDSVVISASFNVEPSSYVEVVSLEGHNIFEEFKCPVPLPGDVVLLLPSHGDDTHGELVSAARLGLPIVTTEALDFMTDFDSSNKEV